VMAETGRRDGVMELVETCRRVGVSAVPGSWLLNSEF
jgi:hypothetical protein